MSKRRKSGDWVWLIANSGFVGESSRLRAQIQPENDPPPDFCADPDCREWSTLRTEPDPQQGGKRHVLCHIGECRMFDEPALVELDKAKKKLAEFFKTAKGVLTLHRPAAGLSERK